MSIVFDAWNKAVEECRGMEPKCNLIIVEYATEWIRVARSYEPMYIVETKRASAKKVLKSGGAPKNTTRRVSFWDGVPPEPSGLVDATWPGLVSVNPGS